MDDYVSPPSQSRQSPYVPPGWPPLLWWMLTSLCSLGLGLLVTSSIVFLSLLHFDLSVFLIAIVLGGVVVGAVQLPFLNARQSVMSGQRWVLTSIIGCSLAVATALVITWFTSRLPIQSRTAMTTVTTLTGYLIGPVSGLILGTSQWLVLRRSIQYAALWVLTTVVSSSILWVIVLLLAGYALGSNGD